MLAYSRCRGAALGSVSGRRTAFTEEEANRSDPMENERNSGSRPKGLLARRRRVDDDSGVAIAEFALVLPILMLVVMGLVDFGRALNYWIDQQHIANEVARWAAVNGSPVSNSSCTTYSTAAPCQYIAEALEAPANTRRRTSERINICLRFPTGSTGQVGQPVEIVVRARYGLITFLANELGVGSLTIRTTATMRIERGWKGDGTDTYLNETATCT
jgi:Flp pilus assembly protein TadG